MSGNPWQRLRETPLVGRIADWGTGPHAASKQTSRVGARIAGLQATEVFKAAKWAVRAGLALQLTRRRPAVASALYLAAGLMFRYAWVGAGPPSARDDRTVAEMARSQRHGH